MSAALLGIIGVFALVINYVLIGNVVELAFNGKSAIGTVVEYDPKQTGRVKTRRTYHYHYLNADGNILKIDLGRRYPTGKRLPVVYLTTDHELAMLGTTTEGAYSFLEKHLGFKDVVTFIFAFGAFYLSWSNIKEYRLTNKGKKK